MVGMEAGETTISNSTLGPHPWPSNLAGGTPLVKYSSTPRHCHVRRAVSWAGLLIVAAAP